MVPRRLKARFKHGTVEITYLDEGVGGAIVLLHGFASTKEVNCNRDR
jgi:hypothetical protein